MSFEVWNLHNFCGSALQKNGFAFLHELDEVGKTLVDK